jgi:hypothetical protein
VKRASALEMKRVGAPVIPRVTIGGLTIAGMAGRCVIAGLAITAGLSAQPRLQDAKVENRAVIGMLDSTFRGIVNAQTAPAWIAYSVPQIPGDRNMCCFNSVNGISWQGCSLEPNNRDITISPGGNATVHLEGAPEFYVFYRVEDRKVGKIRSFSMDCNIEAGGLPVFWLTGVNPAQSIALLESLIPASDAKEDQRISNAAISALGMHGDPAATAALLRLVHHQSAGVRSQALSWLAQTASRQISESAIRAAIDQDPETSVKRKAVIALTQIKNGEGVPLLIEIARTNRNAAIRKEAMTQLGNSKDPRAVKFFEDLLTAR